MKLKKLLGNQSHWNINKELAREIGLNETLILQHLIDWCDYHNKNTIFQTYEQIQADLGLSEHAVKRVGIPKLKQLGFISTERKGVGYKTHYTLHEDVIVQFLTRPSSEVNTTHLDREGSKTPISEVNSPSLIGENNMSSEVNTTHPIGESTLPISNNISIKHIDEEDMDKKCTASLSAFESLDFSNPDEVYETRRFITKKIVDVLLDEDIPKESSKKQNALKLIDEEYNGWNGLCQIMEWSGIRENQYYSAMILRNR